MNLPSTDVAHLEDYYRDLHINTYSLPNNVLEVDVQGVQLLSKLSDSYLNYRVLGQSMAIEHTNIGGGTVKVQKLVWTLAKEVNI